MQSMHELVCRCKLWLHYEAMLEEDSVGDVGVLSGSDPDFVTAIVFR